MSCQSCDNDPKPSPHTRLIALFYDMLVNEMPAGDVEQLISGCEHLPPTEPEPVALPTLGEYARELAERMMAGLTTHVLGDGMRPGDAHVRVPDVTRDDDGLKVLFEGVSLERLGAMKALAPAQTLGATVCQALRLYEWALQMREKGYTLALVKDQTLHPVELNFTPHGEATTAP